MDLSLALLGSLAAAMALDASPDPEPTAPSDDATACEQVEPASDKKMGDKHGRRVCKPDPNAVESLTIEGKQRGQTESELEPEFELNEEEIQALGVNTLGDLVREMMKSAPNARGRNDEPPIILINGQRVTGDMSSIPREAILKGAALREEEALAHGFRADQTVLNYTLKKRFNATTVTNEGQWPVEGGRASSDHQYNLFRIQGAGRTNVTARYHRDSPLFETERGVVRTPLAGAPYDLLGAVVGPGGGEIDPALSVLAGETVTLAAVPASAADGAPDLDDFVAGAGRVAGDGLTASRTLMPRTEQAKLDATYTRSLGGDTTATLSGNLMANNSVSYRGLPGVTLPVPSSSPFSPFANDVTLYRYLDAPEALKARNDTHKVGAALGVTGRKAGWRWTLNGELDRTDTASRTGRGLDVLALRTAIAAGQVNPFAPIPTDLLRLAPRDTTDATATSAKVDLVVNGVLARLPTGDLRATFSGGYDSRRYEAESVRSGVRVDRVLERDRATVAANLQAPLISNDGPLGFLGKLSLNANGRFEDFSDIGGLATVGGGLAWTPVRGLNVSADYSWEEGEPTPQQVNDPVQQIANSLIYDYATGQTAFVTVTSGGNPGLRPDSRQLIKLNINYRPFQKQELRLSANYTATRIDDMIATFPAPSPELEAAFPTRFTRDAQGRLTAFDSRAVNFAHADTEDLRLGLNYSKTWRASKAGASSTTLLVGLNDRWRLRDEVTIHEGMAPLDRLKGASLGQFGNSSRHSVGLNVYLSRSGYTLNAAGFWFSPTRVNAGALTGDLSFKNSPILILGGSLDLGAQKFAKGRPWLKGAKLTASVENVFDGYMHVRDSQGRTPEAYQKPLMNRGSGRSVKLGLRKQF
ncbi:TonB-dependent receptor [Caulobacter segnis]|uniref:TonB-dependent receptor n=1 Tax=Caulobacter segnis TaxID=88688 RepID=UPI001CBEB14C|nr:TonB-dependent receptor [Caulobacter segnis]UAL11358.1 TonB-dependent receptor [Caulobacter segnis]